MPRTVTTVEDVYEYSELSDRAKEKARDWFRQGNLDYDWWEFTYSDAETIGNILGIKFDRKPQGHGNGPCIWFSGFASQGDGACFEGSYSYAKSAAKAIRRHVGNDERLFRIADELQAVQRGHRYKLDARMRHRGHYYHSGCMTVDVSRDGYDAPAGVEEEIKQLMRDFADWIYRRLEAEHDYQQSDEQVEESILANGYEFDEDGDIA